MGLSFEDLGFSEYASSRVWSGLWLRLSETKEPGMDHPEMGKSKSAGGVPATLGSVGPTLLDIIAPPPPLP